MTPERKAPCGTITGRPTMDTTWQTPPELVACVRTYFDGAIPFDAATAENNPCCAVEFATDDGLERSWPAQTWVNPPYGRELKRWLAKITEEARAGKCIVSLLPCARFEQRYMMGALLTANAVCWIRKRVNFIRAETGDRVSGNPYANFFIGWNVSHPRWIRAFGPVGACQALVYLCGPPPERRRKAK